MAKNDSAQTIYKNLVKTVASGKSVYDEEKHCPMVIRVMKEKGRVSAFCKEATISDSSFWRWCNSHPVFNECYRIGKMIALEEWEEEGDIGKYDPNFNIKVWEAKGLHHHNHGKSARVRLSIDPETNPLQQFKQLMRQAAEGEFTSSEIKQIMEAMNFGVRAYETFELQKQVEELQADLVKMGEHKNEQNIIPIEKSKKAN